MSLKEIARLAGTSISTVSRVLNSSEHKCHQEGLSKKIWELAEQLNYLPNTAARSLRKGETQNTSPLTIDILVTRFDSLDKDPFFYELFHIAKEEFLQNGCLMGEVLSFPDIVLLSKKDALSGAVPYRSSTHITAEQRTNSPSHIQKKEGTGLLIFGKCTSELIPILRRRYPYIAGIDRNPTDYEYDEVICDGTIAADKAVEHLISLGHTNIAYIGDCTYEARYIGYYQALLRHKIPISYGNVHQTGQTEEEGYQIMQNILSSENKPSAIFCANDCTALGVLNALRHHKKKGYLPSVISIDNIAASEKTTPMLTTIDIPKREMVHLAVSLLIDRQKNLHKEHVRIELPCHLIERESCSYY